jgi:hypothetical protein
MDFLRRKMPVILKGTSGVCDILSACIVPGAGIAKIGVGLLSGIVGDGTPDYSGELASMSGQLSDLQLGQNQLSDTVKVGFERINASFARVFGELKAIESALASQRETLSQILEVVTDLRY